MNTTVFYYKNNICLYTVLYVSTLKGHHQAVKELYKIIIIILLYIIYIMYYILLYKHQSEIA